MRESLGFPDADHPGVRMRYLNTRSDLFTISGVLYVSMGILLAITTLSIWEAIAKEQNALLFSFGSLFAGFAAARPPGLAVFENQILPECVPDPSPAARLMGTVRLGHFQVGLSKNSDCQIEAALENLGVLATKRCSNPIP